MNFKAICCCLYLFNKEHSEEDAPLKKDNEKALHKRLNFMSGLLNRTREKREKASCTHDQLHHRLGRDISEARSSHIYTRPNQAPKRDVTPESVSLVKRIVGKRLYKTFEKNNKLQNQESVAPVTEINESPYDSFEATESFEAANTSMTPINVTGSLTNRNPRVIADYQNMNLPPQPDYRYVKRESIPAPPPRCYYNQSVFSPKFDTRRQIKSFQ
ncbi:hypothetical protein LOD99_6842 [Oopsacas minuta]|uniref:Uncharacterized protein n=1 Tax=Oopsacas minuta TaxID=111878 RepID=A0AAV7JJM5_9METZ|nr:hypothetical protein LOD99_6842 [Oopsacas minuta]